MSSTTEHVPEDKPEGTDAPVPADAGDTDIDKLRTALEAAKAEAAEHLDRFLRAKAEADNVRKRTEAEIANIRKYAVESFAAEMLAVHDSLDLARSVSLADSATAVEKMHEGLELTLKLMDGVLAKFGVAQLDPKGEKFDPARHQALSMVESAEVAPNHIVTVVQKGYLLRDRLLRPAMVLVAKAPAAEAPGNT